MLNTTVSLKVNRFSEHCDEFDYFILGLGFYSERSRRDCQASGRLQAKSICSSLCHLSYQYFLGSRTNPAVVSTKSRSNGSLNEATMMRIADLRHDFSSVNLKAM